MTAPALGVQTSAESCRPDEAVYQAVATCPTIPAVEGKAGWSGLTDPGEVRSGLTLLEDLHWVRPVEVRPAGKGGRPTLEYHINPAVVTTR